MRRLALTLAVVASVATACGGDDPAGVAETWEVSLGSAAAETSFGAAATPDGGVVVALATEGDVFGAAAGGRDIVVASFDASGEEQWQVQFGSEANDAPLGVDVADDGTVYVGGYTEGSLGADHQGSADVWLAQISSAGSIVWTAQFGGPEWDRGFDVSAADDGAYVTGYTAGVLDPASDAGGFDGYVTRFDADGAQLWVRQIGTDSTDWGQGSAAFDGGVYVTGYTEGAFPGFDHRGDKDAWVARLTSDGDVEWIVQLGSDALDWTQGVGIGPDGGVLIAGSTEGSLAADGAGGRDALIASFAADGSERWVTQLGTAENDAAFEVRLSGDHVVASGNTAGPLGGEFLGERDAIFIRLDAASGALVSIEQFGTELIDETTGLDVAPDGSLVYSGYRSTADRGTDVFVGGVANG